MKEITLTKGFKTQVSDQRFAWLSKWTWYVHFRRGQPYAARSEYDPLAYREGKSSHGKTISMHREIASQIGLIDVDHKDRDTLNNQDNNLRPCTRAQNCWNQKIRRTNTSGYKGVNFKLGCPENPWVARLSFNNKRIHIGYFSTPREAAKAYDQKAQELFGNFALLNFPDKKR